jgi:AraC family transcriptional regulator, transcriptional activator of pobA
MRGSVTDITSINELHRFYGYGAPQHPKLTIIDLTKVKRSASQHPNQLYRLGFYAIFFKSFRGVLKYGQSSYDFDEGTLVFMAPHQVTSASREAELEEGWGLFFHPDLLNSSILGQKISSYSFFQYQSNEALFLSEEEKTTIGDCLEKIRKEISNNMDRHTRQLILDNIQLLLNYCRRFYDRQFLTRSEINNDFVQKFEAILKQHFEKSLVDSGLPDVEYFASQLNLSAYYLSDLLKKYTGKTTLEYIHLQIIDRAKSMLWGTSKSMSEIAYELGFEYPSHFTKLFKSKTGMAPTEYRNRER